MALVALAFAFDTADPRAAAPPAPAAVAIDERLPDLDQEVPADLEVHTVPTESGTPSYRLGFRSAVSNVGTGPLIVEGTRPDTSTPAMTVDQIIERPGSTPRIVTDVGRMEYATSVDHSHWHYLQFDRYELQQFELHAAGDGHGGGPTLVADRKTGFCLGDRYHVADPTLSYAPPGPVMVGRCGLFQPELLTLREGISVGYGDDYKAFLEGQELPLDGLAVGRYLLVHRVNVDQRLDESSYANNASSALFELRWDNGTPTVTTLAACADSDHCGQ